MAGPSMTPGPKASDTKCGRCGRRAAIRSLPGPRQRIAGAGQTVSTRLLTRCAGVHVDFHAHRHFHNLRSFPTHQVSPKQCWHDIRADTKNKWTMNPAQGWNVRCRGHSDAYGIANFALGPDQFALGQGNAKQRIDGCAATRRKQCYASQQSLSADLLSALAPPAC
jgi:hypothetical protein